MGLINFNAPDYSGALYAINGHLYDISENTKRMSYSLNSIEYDMERVANCAEIAVGLLTKEEIIAQREIERLQDELQTEAELSEYKRIGDEERKYHQEQCEKIELQIHSLEELIQRIVDERRNAIKRKEKENE